MHTNNAAGSLLPASSLSSASCFLSSLSSARCFLSPFSLLYAIRVCVCVCVWRGVETRVEERLEFATKVP
jgi:hypothetical protein